jgi:hypothetical protein
MGKRSLQSVTACLAVIVSAVISCSTSGPPASEAPPEVARTRDAAMSFVRGHFDQAPPESASWTEESVTPADVIGGVEWRYTAGDWVVTVSYPVVAPEWLVYHAQVMNEDTGFEWEGRVSPSGEVPEAPEHALAARDQALLHVSEKYDLSGLGGGLAWQEARLTPENVVGAETYQYTAGDWVVTVSYPVVLPENTIYAISVTHEGTDFQWEGEVDAQGTLTEH